MSTRPSIKCTYNMYEVWSIWSLTPPILPIPTPFYFKICSTKTYCLLPTVLLKTVSTYPLEWGPLRCVGAVTSHYILEYPKPLSLHYMIWIVLFMTYRSSMYLLLQAIDPALLLPDRFPNFAPMSEMFGGDAIWRCRDAIIGVEMWADINWDIKGRRQK